MTAIVTKIVAEIMATINNPDAALRELLDAVQAPRSEPARLRRALTAVSGVALLVGQVGAPVVEAVRKLAAALGV